MTRKEFEAIVKDALQELPKEFKDKLQNIDVVIEAVPGKRAMDIAETDDQGELLGLYEGVPLAERTHEYGAVMPDKITLFQDNIEEECRSEGLDIREEITHVVQHEIAHHFGISDERLEDLDIY